MVHGPQADITSPGLTGVPQLPLDISRHVPCEKHDAQLQRLWDMALLLGPCHRGGLLAQCAADAGSTTDTCMGSQAMQDLPFKER